MSLRNLSLFRRDPPPSEPEWTSTPKPEVVTAETIGYAVIRLYEIEATKPHGGKRGRELVDLRLKQKARINELLEAFAEGRRHEGRDLGEGSIAERHVVRESAGNKASIS